jgi:hypothetical protein
MEWLSLIEECPTQHVHKFLYQIIDELCGREPVVEHDFVPNIWTDSVTLGKVVNSWKQFFRHSTSIRGRSEINAEISEDKRKIVYECLEVRKGEIRSGIIDEIVRTSNTRPVLGYDWQLKMVLSSDKMANLNEYLVNLDINVQKGNDSESEVISLELNKEELNKFIEALEEAKSALDTK